MDFNQILATGSFGLNEKNIDPIDIFSELKRRTGYGYLRTNQEKFLKKWNDRRTEKDIVGLLETGSGKTLIGLLVLMSKMREYKLPVIYVLPTRQLVTQTINQAGNYGISVTQNLDESFYDAKKILVTTFDKLFNGRSKFGVTGDSNQNEVELGAIVIDDAHAAVKRAESQATLTVKKSDEIMKYNALLNLFRKELENQSKLRLNKVETGESENLVLKVPYWSVKNNKEDIFKVLMKDSNNEFGFHAPFVMDYLDKTDIVISSNEISFRLKKVPIELVPSFYKAKHRLFMSATMVRPEKFLLGLDVDVDALKTPIDLTESGMAEGMKLILNPASFDDEIDRVKLKNMIDSETLLSRENKVVLVPSKVEANKWSELGAEVFIGDDIDDAVWQLKTEAYASKWYVFVNRYEGIDINGNASHILIIDGTPKNFDVFDKSKGLHGSDAKEIHKIQAETLEQGIGRTVRDNTDYSLVLLFGQELTSLINRRDFRSRWSKKLQMQRSFGEDLTAQLDKNLDVMKQIMDAFLRRDEKFSNVYINYFKSNDSMEVSPLRELIDEGNLNIVLKNFQKSSFGIAISKLNEMIPTEKDNNKKGELFELLAEITNFTNQADAQQIQIKARNLNDRLLMPQSGTLDRINSRKLTTTAAKDVYDRLKDRYDRASDFEQVVVQALDKLTFNGPKFTDFEQSMEFVGEFLGFYSVRPDNSWNEGPDNLWLASKIAFIFEDKNEATTTEYSKDYFGQLSVSEKWIKSRYPFVDYIPIAVFPTKIAEHKIKTSIQEDSIKVMDSHLLELLVDRLHGYFDAIIKNFNNINAQVIQDQLNAFKLTESDLKEMFLRSNFK